MKKALIGFWRGGRLGSILGFFGGELAIILFFLIILIKYPNEIINILSQVDFFTRLFGGGVIFFGMSLYIALPGLVVGGVIGGLLGIVFGHYSDQLSTWKRIGLSLLGAGLMHLIALVLVSSTPNFSAFIKETYQITYINWGYLFVPISIIVAGWFGYVFPKHLSIDTDKLTKGEIKGSLRKFSRQTWKGMMVGVVVGLIWIAGILLYISIINFGVFFEELLDDFIWFLFDILIYIPLGGGLGFIFGIMFLIIPDKSSELVRIFDRLIIVVAFFGTFLTWLVFESGLFEPYQQQHISEWLFPIRFSMWGPIFFVGFIVIVFGVVLFDRLHVWTPKFLRDTQES